MKFEINKKEKEVLTQNITKDQQKLEEIQRKQNTVDGFHPLTKTILDELNKTLIASYDHQDYLLQHGLLIDPIIKNYMFHNKVESLINEKEVETNTKKE